MAFEFGLSDTNTFQSVLKHKLCFMLYIGMLYFFLGKTLKNVAKQLATDCTKVYYENVTELCNWSFLIYHACDMPYHQSNDNTTPGVLHVHASFAFGQPHPKGKRQFLTLHFNVNYLVVELINIAL